MSGSASFRKSVRRIGSTLIAATLDVYIAAAEAPVFDFVAAEDVLPKVLTGYGLLPGVVRTSGNTGPWDQPGSVRTVHLADGNTAREQVTAYEQPYTSPTARANTHLRCVTSRTPQRGNGGLKNMEAGRKCDGPTPSAPKIGWLQFPWRCSCRCSGSGICAPASVMWSTNSGIRDLQVSGQCDRLGIVGYSSLIRLWKSGPSCAYKDGQAPTLAMGPARGLGRSLGGGHLRRLFGDFAGVKDEFERIGILVLLHQLEIHEPLGIGHCRAVIEPIPGRFKQ